MLFTQFLKPILRGLHAGVNSSFGPADVAAILCDTSGNYWVFDPANSLLPYQDEVRRQLTSGSAAPLDLDTLKDIQGSSSVEVPGVTFEDPSIFSQALQAHRLPYLQCVVKLNGAMPYETYFPQEYVRAAAQILATAILDSRPETAKYGRYELESHTIYALASFVKQSVEGSSVYAVDFLRWVAAISRSREEGSPPRGLLVAVPEEQIKKSDLLLRLSGERPMLQNAKHICKLLLGSGSGLGVEGNSEHQYLLSNGDSVLGLAKGSLPEKCVVAVFEGAEGFIQCETETANHQIAAFSEGTYSLAPLPSYEPALVEALGDNLVGGAEEQLETFSFAQSIVTHSQETRHGCTLVLGAENPSWKSGQRIDPVLPLREPQNLRIANTLAGIDGALHIDSQGSLLGFGCLLDGKELENKEDLARGARYNSALRFTHERPDSVVLTVSADGPVTVFSRGEVKSGRKPSPPLRRDAIAPVALSEW